MLVFGLNAADVESAIKTVSRESYSGNLDITASDVGRSRDGRPKSRFTLKVRDSKGPGHRLSQSLTTAGNRRRMSAACWHAYRDAIAALFEANPDARVQSAGADYNGREDFLREFDATGARNIGSAVDPLRYRDACECNWEHDSDSPVLRRLRSGASRAA